MPSQSTKRIKCSQHCTAPPRGPAAPTCAPLLVEECGTNEPLAAAMRAAPASLSTTHYLLAPHTPWQRPNPCPCPPRPWPPQQALAQAASTIIAWNHTSEVSISLHKGYMQSKWRQHWRQYVAQASRPRASPSSFQLSVIIKRPVRLPASPHMHSKPPVHGRQQHHISSVPPTTFPQPLLAPHCQHGKHAYSKPPSTRSLSYNRYACNDIKLQHHVDLKPGAQLCRQVRCQSGSALSCGPPNASLCQHLLCFPKAPKPVMHACPSTGNRQLHTRHPHPGLCDAASPLYYCSTGSTPQFRASTQRLVPDPSNGDEQRRKCCVCGQMSSTVPEVEYFTPHLHTCKVLQT